MIFSKLGIRSKAGALATGIALENINVKSSKALAVVLNVEPSSATTLELTLAQIIKKDASTAAVTSAIVPNLKALKRDLNEDVFVEIDLGSPSSAGVYDISAHYDATNGTEFIVEFESSCIDGNTAQFGGSSLIDVEAKTDAAATGFIALLEDGRANRPVYAQPK